MTSGRFQFPPTRVGSLTILGDYGYWPPVSGNWRGNGTPPPRKTALLLEDTSRLPRSPWLRHGLAPTGSRTSRIRPRCHRVGPSFANAVGSFVYMILPIHSLPFRRHH